MLPSWLLKPFVAPLAIAIAALSLIGNVTLGASLYFEKRYSAKLETRVTDLTTNNGILKANNATLKAAVVTQNAAVDGLAAAAQASAASAKAGQAAAEVAASALDNNAKALGKLAPPPPGADRCAAASQLIRTTLAGEHAK
jgi:hypothetical protein